VTRDRQHDTDAGEDFSPLERALLDAALDYYGAAETIIDLSGAPGPRLHVHDTGVRAVRDAMGALAARIHAAHEGGIAPERIARITRLECEVVAAILARPPRAAVRGAPED
jgi:hypothetical protein